MSGSSSLLMINMFQVICAKLQWPLDVQIETFFKILPMNLRQFVISKAHLTFTDVTDSVKTYQELVEVDTVSHIFKIVSFEDIGCSHCNKAHKSLQCPYLRSITEMEESSSTSPIYSGSSSSDTHSQSPTNDCGSWRLVPNLGHQIGFAGEIHLDIKTIIIIRNITTICLLDHIYILHSMITDATIAMITILHPTDSDQVYINACIYNQNT